MKLFLDQLTSCTAWKRFILSRDAVMAKRSQNWKEQSQAKSYYLLWGAGKQFNANVLKNIVPRGVQEEDSSGGSSRVLERS